MSEPQRGIFVEGSPRAWFLEFSLRPSASDAEVVGAVRELLREPERPLGTEPAAVEAVVAFGPSLWPRLSTEAPEGLAAFPGFRIPDGPSAPVTQRDVLVWLHGASEGALFDRARHAAAALGPVATLELDQPAFTYHDSRDFTGFIDGSANPKDEKARAAALVADGPSAGGSFVMTQKWRHDLERFAELPVLEQERVIGRTKADSIELEGEAMPEDSHVARTDVKKDGVAMKIYRRSLPWGTGSEHGLIFLGFSLSLERFDVLLSSMYDPASRDRLLDFSTALTGSYWYAPSARQLRALA